MQRPGRLRRDQLLDRLGHEQPHSAALNIACREQLVGALCGPDRRVREVMVEEELCRAPEDPAWPHTHEFISKAWTENAKALRLDPLHRTAGPYT